MKIALIISKFPILNETFVLDHITGLLDRGHDVHIYATAPKESHPKVHGEVARYRLLDRTVYRETRKFQMPHNPVVRVVKGATLLVRGLGASPRATLNSINVFRLGRAAASLRALYEVAPFTKCRDYDIVHCHFPENGRLAVSLRDVGALRGKIITEFHSYHAPSFRNGRPSHKYASLFEKGDLFLSHSEHEKRWFDEADWGRGKRIVHRHSVRVGLFDASPPRPDGGPIRVLSVGRFVEKKGFAYGVMGVARVLRRFPHLQYDIVGDGPLRPSLERLIGELGATNNIRLLGWQDRDELLRLLGGAQIFLAPCVTAEDGDRETGPVVVLEAMAAGLPVISTWHNAIPEIVQDGESGFLVAERDVEGIADRLTRLLERPETGYGMGQRGRKHVEEHHDLDKQLDRLIEIYRLVAQERFPCPA